MFTVRTFYKRGFTLIELMVVVAVIAILATIALFGLSGVQKGARDTQRIATMNGVRTALERYNSSNGSYPAGNFGVMAAVLTSGNYLTNVFDPGCGAATFAFLNQTDVSGAWAPCSMAASAAVAPWYSYTVSGGTYTLQLMKESAGSAVFRGPQ